MIEEVYRDTHEGLKKFMDYNGFDCDKCKNDLAELKPREEEMSCKQCEILVEEVNNLKRGNKILRSIIKHKIGENELLEEEAKFEQGLTFKAEEELLQMEDCETELQQMEN